MSARRCQGADRTGPTDVESTGRDRRAAARRDDPADLDRLVEVVQLDGHGDLGLAQLGWEKLLNRKGTTWRKLDAAVQASVVDGESAKALMLANPSTIKRPVVQWTATRVTVGFTPSEWA